MRDENRRWARGRHGAVAAESQPTEEDAVRKVIETLIQAIDQQDLGRLLAHLTEDAVIDSRIAQGKVNKQRGCPARC